MDRWPTSRLIKKQQVTVMDAHKASLDNKEEMASGTSEQGLEENLEDMEDCESGGDG